MLAIQDWICQPPNIITCRDTVTYILYTAYATYCHVGLAPYASCVAFWVDGHSGYSKITHLYASIVTDEDIRWLHIWANNNKQWKTIYHLNDITDFHITVCTYYNSQSLDIFWPFNQSQPTHIINCRSLIGKTDVWTIFNHYEHWCIY